MPSLNLRNVLRRNPDSPTLRQRAAALKAAAGKVIHRPKPAAVASPAEEAGTILDSILLSRSQELVAIEALQEAALKVASFADAHDCPDWVEMERERKTFLAQVIGARAHTMAGVKAKAAVLDLESVKHSRSAFDGLSRSIAADVAALGILPQPEQAASAAAAHVDPHTTLLPALRQAYAWDRACRPILEHADDFSPEGTACHAVTFHCWNTASRIIDLPPPATLAGLGALALAQSVWAEEVIGLPKNDGGDDERYPEERRLASAIRAMMSVAGVDPLPGWVGFEVEPCDRPRWAAMLEQQGQGSLPAWALAGKAGPDDGEIATGEKVTPAAASAPAAPAHPPVSDLARACVEQVERMAQWRRDRSEPRTDEQLDADLDAWGAALRRAIAEPSANLADLAAKARLMLADMEHSKPEEERTQDDERLMLVILREIVAQGARLAPVDGREA